MTDNPITTVEGGKDHCDSCSKALCLRQQVINLALGNVEEMMCLVCLGKDSAKEPEKVLSGIKDYIHSRPCFEREWTKYVDESYCPDPDGCFPSTCFAESGED